EAPKDKNDIFSGINTTWNRVKNGGEVGGILYDIEENFDFTNPAKHLPKLLEAYTLINKLEDEHWKRIKTTQIKEIIAASLGLYLEASAVRSSAVPNSKIDVNFEVINRSNYPIELISIQPSTSDKNIYKGISLTNNEKKIFKENISLKGANYSDPYWLRKAASLGMYSVDDKTLIGKPETPREITIDFNLVINYIPITITKNVIRRYSKRDKGEIYEPFEIVPSITTKLKDKVLVFSDSIAKKVEVEVRAGANFVSGTVNLEIPKDWSVTPNEIGFNIAQKNDKQMVVFTVTPPKNQSKGNLQVVVKSEGETFTKELIEINYSHIPKQTALKNSEAKIVRLNIKKKGNNIGYIRGAGDAVPESLQQIGYHVIEINPTEINDENLQQFDAIVLGIRAYSVVNELQFKQKYLLEYVKNGGNMIVQYNTSRGVDVQAPYPLKLSRDRVTDELAEVIVLDPNNSLLNYPNKITENDFKGWVQERGLYFPNMWSDQYTPILSMKDKGETPKLGSLLIAKYGKGNYIYTGLSFFRELPAGVSGAYKLFANMISVGKE
ncbi:MAG: LmbE family protein, partial [Polaribacter sp.]